MRKILFLWIICTISGLINGAWIDNMPGEVSQPDGTIIAVLFTGDEFNVRAHDSKGYTIVQDMETGFWCWAIKEEGNLVSNGYPIHKYSAESLDLIPHINISVEKYQERRRAFDIDTENDQRTPTRNTINNLVVFIRFSDDSPFTTSLSSYEDMFNNYDINDISMKQYFYDSSYGQLNVNSHFFPTPSYDSINSYQSSYPRAYYQPYNAISNQIGYSDGFERTFREQNLIYEAVNAIQSQVPVNLIISSNDNGQVDNVCFVIKGGTQAWNELLWPHMWVLFYNFATINGKQVWSYNFNIENHLNFSGVRVLSHEFAHTLGVPDYYRYGFNGTPIGLWDIMSNNTNPPQSLNSLIKRKYLGWTPEIPIITTSGTYTLFPLTTHREGHVISVQPTTNQTGELYIIEYRSAQTGVIDSALPGSGLLVYKYNPSIYGNSDGPPDELYIYRPFGTQTTDGLIDSAFFSLESGRTVLNSTSNPTPFLSNGLDGGLNIMNIGSAGESITFTITFGNQDILPLPRNLVANSSFESITLEWLPPFDSQIFNLTSYKISREGSFLAYVDLEHTSYTLEDLLFGTYTYNVSAVYEEGESAPATVYVVQGVIDTFPYFQDFSLIPENWTRANGVLTQNTTPIQYLNTDWFSTGYWSSAWMVGNYINDLHHENGFGAYAKMNSTHKFWLITPTLYLSPSINEHLISFDLAHTSYFSADSPIGTAGNDKKFMVLISTENGANFSSNMKLAEWNNIGSTRVLNNISHLGENIEISLVGYNGYRKIAFYIESLFENTDSYIHIDNVSIYHNPVTNKEITTIETGSFLINNYPNPFNPETTIKFYVGTMSEKQTNVQIDIYNIKGKKIRNLVKSDFSSGVHSVSWNGKDNTDQVVGSGVYFYHMKVGDIITTKKMILLK